MHDSPTEHSRPSQQAVRAAHSHSSAQPFGADLGEFASDSIRWWPRNGHQRPHSGQVDGGRSNSSNSRPPHSTGYICHIYIHTYIKHTQRLPGQPLCDRCTAAASMGAGPHSCRRPPSWLCCSRVLSSRQLRSSAARTLHNCCSRASARRLRMAWQSRQAVRFGGL